MRQITLSLCSHLTFFFVKPPEALSLAAILSLFSICKDSNNKSSHSYNVF